MLSPLERLKIHLELHHPEIRLQDIHLTPKPGYVESRRGGTHTLIDLRGAGYPRKIGGRYVPVAKLWTELFEYYSRVEVKKTRHTMPTVIRWGGRYYTLDTKRTYTPRKGK